MKIVVQILAQVLLIVWVAADPQDDADTACNYLTQPVVLTEQSGTLETQNYPGYYEDYSDCRWHINPTDAPDNWQIYLDVEDFYTESYDSLTIYAGDSIYGEELYYFSGGSYYEGTYATGVNELFFYFYSDVSISYQGFRISYSLEEISPLQIQSQIACDATQQPAVLNNMTGGVQSLNYPSDYPAYTECHWYINPTDNTGGIYLSVVDFYTYYDYLYIYEGNDDVGSYLTYWYYSQEPGTTIYTSGNELFLEFYYPYYTERGFELVYYPVDPACTSGGGTEIVIGDGTDSDGDGVPDDQSGVITSPGYPYTVPEHLACRWLITAPEGQKIVVNSQIINLEYTVGCTDEYLEIIDGPNVNDLSLGRYCGNSTFGNVASTSNAMQLYLKTHEIGYFTNIGFSVAYDAQDSSSTL